MTRDDEKLVKNILTEALKDAFSTNEKTQRFVDVTRIPLICKNIEGMHQTLGKLDEYIKNDANWKKEFDVWKTQVVTPLIQKEADDKAVNNFVTKSGKYVAGVVAFLISIALLYNYIIDPLIKAIKNP